MIMDEILTAKESLKIEQKDILKRKAHTKRLIEGLIEPLEDSEALVPVQTWTVYWITHSLSLLEQQQFLSTISKDVINLINECAHEAGGYGGGPGQIAHLATTFAAINALITTVTEEALDSIDRVKLVRFLHKMKQPDGSFSMHEDGEIDSRATYCALSILRCLNIHDTILLENVADWILDCQTYEGGFGSVPGCEAHGGYTFCCVASLCLLNQLHRADLPALLRWLTNKQTTDAGGFCGRSNKLVDSCYSYWQGSVFPLLYPLLKTQTDNITSPSDGSRQSNEADLSDKDHEENTATKVDSRPRTRSSTRNNQMNRDELEDSMDSCLDRWLFDCEALQDYVLNQCQSKYGLLQDKPGARPDFYHTCYALSGYSISQHQPDGSLFDIGSMPINQILPTHPLFNLTFISLNQCFDYFKNKKLQTTSHEHDNEE